MGHRKPKQPPFIMFQFKMLNSLAYKSLSPSSAKALVFFLAKVKLPDSNDQRYREIFTLSYGELKAAASLSDKTCSKVFRELVKVGFIHPVEKGGLRGNGKSCSKYKLSRRWEQYQQPGFKEVDLKKFVA